MKKKNTHISHGHISLYSSFSHANSFTSVEMSQLVARRERLALLEADLARHINVKEVDLAMGRNVLALGVVDRAGVVHFVVCGVAFGDRASNQVGLCFLKVIFKPEKEVEISYLDEDRILV